MTQWRSKLAAEVFGTFALVFAGTGAIIANHVYDNENAWRNDAKFRCSSILRDGVPDIPDLNVCDSQCLRWVEREGDSSRCCYRGCRRVSSTFCRADKRRFNEPGAITCSCTYYDAIQQSIHLYRRASLGCLCKRSRVPLHTQFRLQQQANSK